MADDSRRNARRLVAARDAENRFIKYYKGVLGTLFGACAGAFLGSVAGDVWAGRSVDHSIEAGRGAATGRLWGTVVKLALGSAIFLLLAVDAFRSQ